MKIRLLNFIFDFTVKNENEQLSNMAIADKINFGNDAEKCGRYPIKKGQVEWFHNKGFAVEKCGKKYFVVGGGKWQESALSELM